MMFKRLFKKASKETGALEPVVTKEMDEEFSVLIKRLAVLQKTKIQSFPLPIFTAYLTVKGYRIKAECTMATYHLYIEKKEDLILLIGNNGSGISVNSDEEEVFVRYIIHTIYEKLCEQTKIAI